MEAKLASLRGQLAERTEEAREAGSGRRALQRTVDEMKRSFQEQQRASSDISQQMTRQYKQMQERYVAEVSELSDAVRACEARLGEARAERERLEKLHEAELQRKDGEIAALRAKEEDAAAEFSEMLRETLRALQQRIEMSPAPSNAEDAVHAVRRQAPRQDLKA